MKLKGINIKIPEKLHKEIKVKASQEGITLKNYIIKRLKE